MESEQVSMTPVMVQYGISFPKLLVCWDPACTPNHTVTLSIRLVEVLQFADGCTDGHYFESAFDTAMDDE